MTPRDLIRLARAVARPRGAARLDGMRLPERRLELPAVAPDARRIAALRALTKYPDDGRVPITYPQVLAFPSQFLLLADPTCDVPVAGLIHLGMRIHQARPIGAGERLAVVTRAANGRVTGRGFEFDMLTEVTARDACVWRGTASLLVKKPAAPRDDKPRSAKPKESPALPAGAREQEWRVSPSLIRAYARVSRDVNPIHWSALTAKAFGMPRAVAHGMWSLTRLAGTALDRLGDERLVLDASFKLPLFVPAKALCRTWDQDGVRHLRLFDGAGEKPHVVATLTVEDAHV